jgi:hypothetical protein
VDKVALGQVFSEYFDFPFHQMLHTRLSSGSGTIHQLVADVPSGLSLTPSKETKQELFALSDISKSMAFELQGTGPLENGPLLFSHKQEEFSYEI